MSLSISSHPIIVREFMVISHIIIYYTILIPGSANMWNFIIAIDSPLKPFILVLYIKTSYCKLI